MRKAIGTSAAIGILIAISGTISMISSGALFAKVNSPLSFGYFNLAGFLVFVPVTMMMAPLGAKVVHKVSRNLITKIFGIYMGFNYNCTFKSTWGKAHILRTISIFREVYK